MAKRIKKEVVKTPSRRRKHYTQKDVFKKYGIRSGLEDKAKECLDENEIKFEYETLKLTYTIPESIHSYKPDFIFPNKENPQMIIETKGRWMSDDIKKMKLIKEQYPDLDIRMVFTNSKTKIRKGSPTSYADKCKQLNIKCADKVIPQEWIEEIKKLN